MGAAQRAEGSEFKHDRLLKRFVMGRDELHPTRYRWFMTAIIYQSTIDKKRKKCGITIETTDKKRLERISSNLQFIA
ncbi:hypothetical protein A1354_08840 [Pseudomonas asplenii]|nr:hypothetical protein A1354_08840 [Pseudomonas asplenii]